MARIRLDQLLVERGLATTRTRAQAMIMSGIVLVNEHAVSKSGQLIEPDASLRLKGKDHPWVSRGGLKLAKALKHFNLNVNGSIALDIGASTGGFTDVLLHHGAAKVYAVDVGHGQLDWRLRNDARVVVLEKTNARYLDTRMIPDTPDMIVCDASFISLKTVLPASLSLAAPHATLCALIKPQFEAGREQVGNGVITDPALHAAICEDITDWMNACAGWQVQGITESPITGPKGNIEFLLCAIKR